MKIFKIEIVETSARIIEIKAPDIGAAIQKVTTQYHNEDIVLDESDFVDYEIKAL